MQQQKSDSKKPASTESNKEKAKPDGYPVYPASEDIYIKSIEMVDVDPEQISKKKSFNQLNKHGQKNEIDFDQDLSGNDLDVPGAELDDADEKIGSEDEENNAYSVGGDRHNDLEEYED